MPCGGSAFGLPALCAHRMSSGIYIEHSSESGERRAVQNGTAWKLCQFSWYIGESRANPSCHRTTFPTLAAGAVQVLGLLRYLYKLGIYLGSGSMRHLLYIHWFHVGIFTDKIGMCCSHSCLIFTHFQAKRPMVHWSKAGWTSISGASSKNTSLSNPCTKDVKLVLRIWISKS